MKSSLPIYRQNADGKFFVQLSVLILNRNFGQTFITGDSGY